MISHPIQISISLNGVIYTSPVCSDDIDGIVIETQA